MNAPDWIFQIPYTMQNAVLTALTAYATAEYVDFFYRPNCHMPTQIWIKGTKEALQLPDQEAKQRLYEIADEFPYSSATSEHPAFDFAMDGLDMVDWSEVLHRLRLEAAKEAENA